MRSQFREYTLYLLIEVANLLVCKLFSSPSAGILVSGLQFRIHEATDLNEQELYLSPKNDEEPSFERQICLLPLRNDAKRTLNGAKTHKTKQNQQLISNKLSSKN